MEALDKSGIIHPQTGMDGHASAWIERDKRARSTRPHEMFTAPCEISRENIAHMLAVKTISPNLVSGLCNLLEAFLALVTGLICLLAFKTQTAEASQLTALLALVAIACLFIMAAQALHLYEIRIMRDFSQQTIRLAIGWSASFALLFFAAQMAPEVHLFERAWMLPWFVSGFSATAAARLLATFLVRRWTRDGLLERRAVIVGGGREAEELIHSLERQENNDIRICGVFDDRDDARSPDIIAGYPKLGTVPELVEFARAARLDMLIVSLPLTAGGRVREMLKKLWVLPVDIRLSAHSNKMAFQARNYSYIGAMPFLRLADRPIAGWHFIKKRLFDMVGAAFLLILFSPLMLTVAIAIKRDSKGPILFRQKRHGFNNKIIDVWKFRSMYADRCDAAAKIVVTRNDPRVTRIGAFIRKTSIDELPQLWNVLKGELSLVGPRPHAVAAHVADQPWNEAVDGYFARHRVKPGVTGWAQINGWRGEVDTLEKIRKRTDYDLYYIENWSLLFDLYILVMTPVKLMDTRNAY